MSLSTTQYARCIQTLESSLDLLRQADADSIDYEIFRNAVVKGFELTLETAGKLLRKALKAYTGSPRSVDELNYKDVLRHAAKHGLLSAAEVTRWFAYRDNRNNTAHDYGKGFAEDTLALMPAFLADARALETILREKLDHADS
ncbi:MAG TPA: nucleotidyltransferase substrate binding protein [Thermoanaerobaculia bacterium]|jgi:nucleotidyltransferase substrate binding protein (TIGR01987 family)|nr:nucleotidyltransferase substrate binding protein [Thermoanaerobaculia bacterium]